MKWDSEHLVKTNAQDKLLVLLLSCLLPSYGMECHRIGENPTLDYYEFVNFYPETVREDFDLNFDFSES